MTSQCGNSNSFSLSLLSDGQQQQLLIPRAPERHPAPLAAAQGERRRQPQEGAGQPQERPLLRLLHPGPGTAGRADGQEALRRPRLREQRRRRQARHAQTADAQRLPAGPGPASAGATEARAVPAALRDATRLPRPDSTRRGRCRRRRGVRGRERLPAPV